MGTAAKPTRENRTITVDFHDETSCFRLLDDGKAFVECVLAFLLALGFQLKHTATCRGGGCLTRHSHYMRVRLGGLTIWRIQCTTCKAVFTVLPHFVLRYRQMRPEVARDALLATHGGLSLELCAGLYHLSPMALYRVVCALGQQSLVGVLTRCGLPLPVYFLADEKHSRCLTDKVYLPTIVCGRIIWHLGYTEDASAAAFTQSYQAFQHAAICHEPCYQARGILIDGFDSTTSSMRILFPGARLGNCLRHALNKLPKKLTAIASPMRKALRSQFHTLWYRARQRKGLRVFALGQRLRHFVDHVTTTAGAANGARVRRWFQEKKAGWYAVLADPQMPATSTLLDQAHNAIERKLFAMKGFHHPKGSQQAFLTGLAHLYNLVPYQRRAQHAGQCGVEVEGGRVPTHDWFLNVQILTSGGLR
ncbi:MAG TPA: hypothetical protein VI542_08030 [Candidatus Tectomicrobia bacterium]